MGWATVLVLCAGCYLLKLAGLLVPPSLLRDRPRTARAVGLLPAALLAALVVTSAFTTGHRLGLDARAAGLAAAVVALLLRAPLLLVVVVAVLVTAVVRAA